MNLDLLQVLHIKSYNNKGNSENPLAEFKAAVNPFSPMTCSRHVYIFSHETDYHIKDLQTYIDEHSKKCEWLTGVEAYRFLLRWAVGVESHKLQSNDHFVLGAIREAWNSYRATNPILDTTLVKIMQMLLEDARHIRHTIQDEKIDAVPTIELLSRMCQNCVDSRAKDQTPAYEALLQGNQEYLETAKLDYIKKKLSGLSKSMKSLNLKANTDAIAPSQLDLPDPQIRMFRTNLSYALQRQHLQKTELAALEEATATLHLRNASYK